MSREQWKPIKGFEGRYEVSDLGRVRSVDHIVACGFQGKGRRLVKGRVLASAPSRTGHLTVVVSKGNTRAVHSLVCEAFHGPRPEGCEVLHLNHDPADNRAVNLRWGTRSENLQMDYDRGHREGHGKIKRRVKGTCITTGQKVIFDSPRDACKHFNCKDATSALVGVIEGKGKSLFKHRWEWAE